MPRWKKENASVGAKYLREWIETEKGQEYKERSKNYAKEWRKKNKQKSKAIQKRSLFNARLEVLQHYSKKEVPECRCCGEQEFNFLQIDHVEGDGANHRREVGKSASGTGFVYWLKRNNFPKGFQILCANCNYSKRTNKYCIHELKKGVDMEGNAIEEEHLPQTLPELTRRRRGEAEKEAQELGINKHTLRMRRWREKNPRPKVEKEIKTHCKNGHAYADGNLYEWKGHRQCRQCKRDYKSRKKLG